jgi:hypothetical protein
VWEREGEEGEGGAGERCRVTEVWVRRCRGKAGDGGVCSRVSIKRYSKTNSTHEIELPCCESSHKYGE